MRQSTRSENGLLLTLKLLIIKNLETVLDTSIFALISLLSLFRNAYFLTIINDFLGKENVFYDY